MLRSNGLRGLFLSASALALAISTAAVAQDNPAPGVEEVVVTGSHIRGVAPVGTTVITEGQEDLDKQGVTTFGNLLDTLPEVQNAGYSPGSILNGRGVQNSTANYTFANAINLRGLGAPDTLTIVNGMRMPTTENAAVHDPDNVPTMLVSRVDIVADGGSAIYGTDAVAGTANFLLKTPQDIVTLKSQVGHADGITDYSGGVLIGKTWSIPGMGEGGLIVAGQYAHTDPLYAFSRPGIYNDNLLQYFPSTTLQPTTTNPGNVTIGTTLYAIPAGVTGAQGVTLAQLGPAGKPLMQSTYNSGTIVEPSNSRWTAGFNMTQDVTNWLHFHASGFGGWRRAQALGLNTADATISVPNTNPYSPCATAAAAASAGLSAPSPVNSQGIVCPATGTITVAENLRGEIGGQGRAGIDKDLSLMAGFTIDLPFGWQAKIDTNRGQDYIDGVTTPVLNATALSQTVSGVGKPTGVPFFNPFCSDNITGPACNNSATIGYIGGTSSQIFTNIIEETTLNLDGSIYKLPAGEVRLAVGGEYDNVEMFYDQAAVGATVPLLSTNNYANDNNNAAAYYGELFIPLVGADNAMPGIQSLNLTLADRYTMYSNPFVTNNPKYSMDWVPLDGLKIRADYGTSFRAPGLRDTSATIANLAEPIPFNSSTITGINAPANTNLEQMRLVGGDPTMKPERAVTWSTGFDWTPHDVAGLDLTGVDLDLNYYNDTVHDVIGNNIITLATASELNDPLRLFETYYVYNPTYFGSRAVVNTGALALGSRYGIALGPMGSPLTQAQFNLLLPAIQGDPRYSGSSVALTAPLAFICECQRANGGLTATDGMDFKFNYAWDTDWGTAHVGATGNYAFNFDESLTEAAQVVNYTNNLTFNMRFSTRMEAGLERDGWAGTIFLNYKNPYYATAAQLPVGAPASFQHIGANVTFDLALSYAVEGTGTYFDDTSIALAVTDITNQDPPFVLSGGANYDATQATDMNRHVSLTLTRNF